MLIISLDKSSQNITFLLQWLHICLFQLALTVFLPLSGTRGLRITISSPWELTNPPTILVTIIIYSVNQLKKIAVLSKEDIIFSRFGVRPYLSYSVLSLNVYVSCYACVFVCMNEKY